jgi:deoxycytidylate deaminase
MSDQPAERELVGPELFFGLAGAVGTDLDAVCESLATALAQVRYETEVIRLSELLNWVDWSTVKDPPEIDDTTIDRHIATRMDAGDILRERLDRGDALALLAIQDVRWRRTDEDEPVPRKAYIFRSLKHPQEVETLREVYGSNFFLVSAYAPVDRRADDLEAHIARDWERTAKVHEGSAAGKARDLIERDQMEAERDYGQHLGKTFPKADFFADAREHQVLAAELTRFIELIFNHPFHTPTRDENAMFHAQAAALRSAAPGRQVGAVITTSEGSIVSIGTNEVPKTGGGQYWSDDAADNRDHNRNDPNVSETEKQTVVEQIFHRLSERNWLTKKAQQREPEEFYDALEGLRVQSIIEFERVVHAEMSAIVDAATRGVSTKGCQLYTTTFPCHECTRHMIAAGLTRLVYIEPYPKSLASRLHDDAIAIDPDDQREEKVVLAPFVGVAPRRYIELFTPAPEARKKGRKVARPRAGDLPKSVPALKKK